MRTTWRDGGIDKAVTAPLSLIVSAFAPVADVRRHLHPAAALDAGETVAAARRPRQRPQPAGRLGARPGLRPARRRAARPRRPGAPGGPLRRDPGPARDGLLLAYHDRVRRRPLRDAGRDGVRGTRRALDLEPVGAAAKPCPARAVRRGAGRRRPGAHARRPRGCGDARRAAASTRHVLGRPTRDERIRIAQDGVRSSTSPRVDLHRAWSARRTCAAAPARQPRGRRPGARPAPRHRTTPGSRRSSTSIPTTTSPRRSSPRGARPAWRSCASRASTARSRWRQRSTAPASTPIDVHMSDILAGRRVADRLRGLRRLRRLFLRRRARRRRGLGEVDSVQRPGARPVRGLLRARDTLRARRVQRLPDDEQPARAHPRHRALAALRAQSLGAVRGPVRAGRGRADAHRSSSPAWRAAASRSSPPTARAAPSSATAAQPAAAQAARRTALRRQPRRADRALSVQRERLAAGHHRRSPPPTAASRS